MTGGSGPDEATKRAAYYRERAAEARVKAQRNLAPKGSVATVQEWLCRFGRHAHE
jgi:hypothetical protein